MLLFTNASDSDSGSGSGYPRRSHTPIVSLPSPPKSFHRHQTQLLAMQAMSGTFSFFVKCQNVKSALCALRSAFCVLRSASSLFAALASSCLSRFPDCFPQTRWHTLADSLNYTHQPKCQDRMITSQI